MLHCKLQLGCMLILLYLVFMYRIERRKFRQRSKWSIFDGLFSMAIGCVFFDGLTAYMVNNLDHVNEILNMICHMFFLLGIDAFIFLLFLYMNQVTTGKTEKKYPYHIMCIPFVINVLIVVINMPNLRYHEGEISNYSMGLSAYTCFIMAGIYALLTTITFFRRWKYIEGHKRIYILTYLLVFIGLTAFQMIYPQVLLSSICITVIIVGIYVGQENPTVAQLSHYHTEMVTGFATLVENKDGSTGGHIKRTSKYVELLSEELRRRGCYKDILTKDYLNNLYKSAPMHDIGKISVSDDILRKPGKLTEEEFEAIKGHTAKGGEIIRETFGQLENIEYTKMAYEMARYHHEKWNGKGYPDGLSKEEIPLCARIMAVADVFDAVSMNRCYREGLPLEECFAIIKDGSGEDFEPLLAEIFLNIRDKVEEVYHELRTE